MPDGAGGMGQSLFPPGMMPPGMAPLEQEYSKKKTFADRMFTIAHLVGVLGLVMFVVGWWEPRVLERRSRGVIGHGEGLGGRVGTAWGGEGLGVELVSRFFCWLLGGKIWADGLIRSTDCSLSSGLSSRFR
jgi:hypothetical protein